MKILEKVIVVAALSSFIIPSVSYADFGVGVTGFKKKGDYKNLKDKSLLALGLEYRGEKINLDKGKLSYDFTNSNQYAVELLMKSNNFGFKAGDSPNFKGMSRRKQSVDLGGRVIVDTGVGPATFEVTKDVNASKGFQADVKLGGITPHAPHWTGEREITVAAAAGLRYQSAKAVDYYYGVKSSEATANRKAYKGKAAMTPYIGLEAQANITPHVTLNANIGASKKARSIRNSPLTRDGKYELGASIGINYWF